MTSVPNSPLIGFNSDEDTKRLAGILARKLRYKNVSDMMRALLRDKFQESFTAEDVAELLDIGPDQASQLLGESPKKEPSRR